MNHDGVDEALRAKSLPTLRKLLLSGCSGPLSYHQRKQCWLDLLHVPSGRASAVGVHCRLRRRRRRRRRESLMLPPHPTEFIDVQQNRYYNQIKLDVNRTSFPPPTSSIPQSPLCNDDDDDNAVLVMSEIALNTTSAASQWQLRHRRQLFNILQALFSRNQDLHYYQGFHDICKHMLLRLGCERLAFVCCERLALFHLRDAMFTGSLEPMLVHLDLLYRVLEWRNVQLYRHLIDDRQMSQPFFAISWLLTWFAHNIDSGQSSPVLDRLFDIFIAAGPIMVVCFSAALLLAHSEQILGFDGDSSELHGYLQELPKQITLSVSLRKSSGLLEADSDKGILDEVAGSLDELIGFAVDLAESFPPERLSTVVTDEYSAIRRFQTDLDGDKPWGQLFPDNERYGNDARAKQLSLRKRKQSRAPDDYQIATAADDNLMQPDWWDRDLLAVRQILYQQTIDWTTTASKGAKKNAVGELVKGASQSTARRLALSTAAAAVGAVAIAGILLFNNNYYNENDSSSHIGPGDPSVLDFIHLLSTGAATIPPLLEQFMQDCINVVQNTFNM